MLLAFLMAAFSGTLSEIASDSHVGRVKLTDVLDSKKCDHHFESKGNTDGASVDLTFPPVCVVFVLICELVGSSVNQPTASLCHSCWLSLRAQTYEHSR